MNVILKKRTLGLGNDLKEPGTYSMKVGSVIDRCANARVSISFRVIEYVRNRIFVYIVRLREKNGCLLPEIFCLYLLEDPVKLRIRI